MTDHSSANLVSCCIRRMTNMLKASAPIEFSAAKSMIESFLRGVSEAGCDFRTADLDVRDGTLEYMVKIGLGRMSIGDDGEEGQIELVWLDYKPQRGEKQ